MKYMFKCNYFQGCAIKKKTITASLFLTTDFVPNSLTLIANLGETVNLTMHLINSQKRDVTWKYNGESAYATRYRGRKFLCKRRLKQ